MSILVTGANGFVGSALCRLLAQQGVAHVGAVRGRPAAGQVAVGDLSAETDWRQALAGSTTVVHLAARVHVMDETERDPIVAFRAINVDASLNLARQAAAAGVRRFVYVSSVKVNGEATTGTPFGADDIAAPCDPYGVSKLEAERALTAFGRDHGLELVIVRPPLVYGPGVKANFQKLMALAKSGMPLPFGAVDNRRSMVSTDNLADLLLTCCTHPAAAGRIFMASDNCDISTAELLTMLRASMGQARRLIPVPVALMRAAATIAGKSALADRLFGSLQVDAEPTLRALDWRPPATVRESIDRTVTHFLKQGELS